MSRWCAIVMVWMVASFAAACTEISKVSQVKCAGCGEIQNVHEAPIQRGDNNR
jgi:hypothetical protein